MEAEDKTKKKYLENPRLHLRHLHKFRNRVKVEMLGTSDLEWREELEFVIERTDQKIKEIQLKILDQALGSKRGR